MSDTKTWCIGCGEPASKNPYCSQCDYRWNMRDDRSPRFSYEWPTCSKRWTTDEVDSNVRPACMSDAQVVQWSPWGSNDDFRPVRGLRLENLGCERVVSAREALPLTRGHMSCDIGSHIFS